MYLNLLKNKGDVVEAIYGRYKVESLDDPLTMLTVSKFKGTEDEQVEIEVYDMGDECLIHKEHVATKVSYIKRKDGSHAVVIHGSDVSVMEIRTALLPVVGELQTLSLMLDGRK